MGIRKWLSIIGDTFSTKVRDTIIFHLQVPFIDSSTLLGLPLNTVGLIMDSSWEFQLSSGCSIKTQPKKLTIQMSPILRLFACKTAV